MYNKSNFRISSLSPKEGYSRTSGLHVTPEYTEVTNGFYLFRVSTPQFSEDDLPAKEGYEPTKDFKEAFIAVDVAQKIEKSIPQKMTLPILSHSWIHTDVKSPETIDFVTTDLNSWNKISAQKKDEQYPDTTRVLENPGKELNLKFSVNPEYLMKICQQYVQAKIPEIRIEIYGMSSDGHCLRFEATRDDQKFQALLMSMTR